MGLDNILAIAGASRDDWGLVIFGFVLSISIMVGGSLLILKLMKKVPWLIAVGLLAIIAKRMILDDWWVREQIMPRFLCASPRMAQHSRFCRCLCISYT